MKKLALTFVISALVVGLFAVAAYAADWTHPDNRGDETYVQAYGDSDRLNAKVWRLSEGWDDDCNYDREVEVVIIANVAQWARWSCDYHGWEWYVRKPGDYFADCITGTLQSNGRVTISFSGFGDLEAQFNSAVDRWIETFYAAILDDECREPEEEEWVSATELDPVPFPDTQELHDGITWKLWNRIVVENCNSPGLYSNTPTLVLTLDNQADWLEDVFW